MTRKHPHRTLVPVLAVALSSACGEPMAPVLVTTRPAEQTTPVQYPLRTVDGYAVPFLVGLTDSGQIEIVAGFIALTEATHYFEQRTLWREIAGGRIDEQLLVVTGRFTRFADGLEVVTDDGLVLWLPTFGNTIYYRDRLFTYAYWR